MPKGQTLEQRLFGRAAKQENGCWIWTGCTRKGGYGHIRIGRKMFLTHRIAYQYVNGEILDELEVRHKCDNAGCFNPEHLELGTHKQNMQDRLERGRDTNRNKTHCPSGHAYDVDNTRWTGPERNRRQCKACTAARQKITDAKLRAKNALKYTDKPRYIRASHCGKGHEFTVENTMVIKGVYRACKQCRADYQRARRQPCRC